ncbi:hypothetical protein KI387_003757, partial [Taxus chinensis]
ICKLEYVDLYLIHLPLKFIKGVLLYACPKEEEFLPLDLKSTWEGMEKCVEMGFTQRPLGSVIFPPKRLKTYSAMPRFPPAVNQ